MSEGWPAKNLSTEYGSEDHLIRANFEADVHLFGHDKTVAQTLRLNQALKDARNFEAFKTEAGKILTTLNERNLRTEFDTAKATANGTAKVLRAVKAGARFMRHKATQDTHTRPVHAALHNKVWRIDDPKDTDWRAWVVPLGWGCRCNDIFEDDASAADLISAADAERLVGPDEMVRLTREGFLQDRVDKKALFTSRQSYLAGLSNEDKLLFPMDSLTYLEQGQQPWKAIPKAGLSPYKAPAKSALDALADFKATATDAVKAYTDHRGAPIFLAEATLEATPAATAVQYFDLADTLATPDEVYFVPDEQRRNTYLKFHADTVLTAVVEYDKELPQRIVSWQQLPADKVDKARCGLLIHKKD